MGFFSKFFLNDTKSFDWFIIADEFQKLLFKYNWVTPSLVTDDIFNIMLKVILIKSYTYPLPKTTTPPQKKPGKFLKDQTIAILYILL